MLPADLPQSWAARIRYAQWVRARRRQRLLAEAEALEAAMLTVAERADRHLIEQGDAKEANAVPVMDIYGTRWWRTDIAAEYVRLEVAAWKRRKEAAQYASR